MFRSAYITFTKLLQVYNYPLSESNTDSIRSNFKPVFSKDYNQNVIAFKSNDLKCKNPHDWGVLYFPTSIKAGYKNTPPFIKNIGPIKFHFPFYEAKKPLCFFVNEEIIGTTPYRRQPASHECDDYNIYRYSKFVHDAEDQRHTLLCYSLENPLYISAYFNGKCVATGRIYTNLYSCGFVALNVAMSISLDAFRDIETAIRVISLVNPWQQHPKVPWTWRSKIGDGTLHKIVGSLVGLLSDSLYESGTFIREYSSWARSVKIQSDESIESLSKYFNLKEKTVFSEVRGCKPKSYTWRVRNQYEDEYFDPDHGYLSYSYDISKCYILFAKGIDIHNFGCDVKHEYALHAFWRSHEILERLLIKKAILEYYVDFLRDEITDLKLWRLSKIEQSKEDRFIRFSVFITNIYKHIAYLDNNTNKMSSVRRKIYAEYSKAYRLDEVYTKLTPLRKAWEEECAQYESLGIRIGRQVKDSIKEIFKLFTFPVT